MPVSCQEACSVPFGEALGTASGVEAYSNCSVECVYMVPAKHGPEATYTGVKWQCVEYARRYWLAREGVVYGSVDTADDMWTQVREATAPDGSGKRMVTSHINGGDSAPEVGDLIIYRKQDRRDLRFGHVAVVVGVNGETGHVYVAEQNFDNQPWAAPDHARKLAIAGARVIDPAAGDDGIYGWLRLGRVASLP